MKKLEDAKRRFGLEEFLEGELMSKLNGRTPSPAQALENTLQHNARVEQFADAGNDRQLQARNLRLKIEVNRLQLLLNDRDEEIDHLRNPKPFKWICTALLVVLVLTLHGFGLL